MNENIEHNKNIRKSWDKKGGEKLLSLWWFFILGVIGGFIVLGVVIYYNADTNVNPIESSILVDKLVNCLIKDGTLNENVLEDDFEIFRQCNLDGKMFGMGSFLYFNISIYDSDGLVKEMVNGSGIFQQDCKISGKITGKYFPSCTYENYRADFQNKNYLIQILGGSNQIGGKVPLK